MLFLLGIVTLQLIAATQHAFIHPGTLFPIASLEQLGSTINNPDPMVQQAKNDLVNFTWHSLSQPPNARSEVRVVFNPAPHDKNPREAELRRLHQLNEEDARQGKVALHVHFTGDAERCVKHTMNYLLTQDDLHAEKCIDILSAWSSTCSKFGPANQNGPLEAAWGLASFARAAELLKYKYPEWDESGVEPKFIAFVDSILMPNLRYFDKDGKISRFAAKGNWGSSILEARLQYAIFRENHHEFEFCRDNFDLMFSNILISSNGRVSETTRDIAHAQFGLGGMVGLAEMFKHQSIDVYSTNNHLLKRAFEYHADIILGDIPTDLSPDDIKWNGFIPTNWEAVLHHYNQQGEEMPLTKRLLNQNRPENYNFHWGLGTLTHYAHAQGLQPEPKPFISFLPFFRVWLQHIRSTNYLQFSPQAPVVQNSHS